jgi:type VI secretion system protein VasD
MIRREFLAGTGSVLFLSACGGGPSETVVEVTAKMAGGANGGLPLTVALFHLRNPGSFLNASQAGLNDPASALGADLAGQTEFTMRDGDTVNERIVLGADVTAIGVYGYFKNPAGKNVRATIPVAAGATTKATVTASPSGVSVG